MLFCMLPSLFTLEYFLNFSIDLLKCPKIPLQWLVQSLCCHFLMFLSGLVVKWDLVQQKHVLLILSSSQNFLTCYPWCFFPCAAPGSFVMFLGSCWLCLPFCKETRGSSFSYSQGLSWDISVQVRFNEWHFVLQEEQAAKPPASKDGSICYQPPWWATYGQILLITMRSPWTFI